MSTASLLRGFVDGPPPAEGPIRFVAATEGRKLDGLDVRMAGADLTRYAANPVVLWNHDGTRPPVGRGFAEVVGPRLMLDVEFDRADPFAADLESKYRRGFLNAVSAHGIATAPVRNGVMDRWQLVEVSTVSVPVDASAVATRRAMADLGRELLALAGHQDHEDDDLRVLTGLRDTLAERRTVDELEAIRTALATRTGPSIDRIKRAVRTALADPDLLDDLERRAARNRHRG